MKAGDVPTRVIHRQPSVIHLYFGRWTAANTSTNEFSVMQHLFQLLFGNYFTRFNNHGKGRASGGVLLLAAGAPHLRLGKILPGFFEYLPQHAARTKKGPIYKARKASYYDGGMQF